MSALVLVRTASLSCSAVTRSRGAWTSPLGGHLSRRSQVQILPPLRSRGAPGLQENGEDMRVRVPPLQAT